jgi:hypothetical protein
MGHMPPTSVSERASFPQDFSAQAGEIVSDGEKRRGA